jgi:predicted metal-dependent peptidase
MKPEERVAAEVESMRLVQKARVHVAVYHCFFGALLERLKLRLDWRHPTMYTDAVVIGFSPAFVLTLRWEYLVFIMVHEVMHCALGHPFRRGGRDPKTWNEAIDHVVNLALLKDPVLAAMWPMDAQGRPQGLADPRFSNMAAEEVYTILWREKEQQKQEQKQRQSSKQQGEEGDQPQVGQRGDEKGEGEEELAGASGMPGDCCDAGASGEPLHEAPDQEGEDGEEELTESDLEEASEAEAIGGEAPGNPVGNDQASIERLAREWEEAVTTAQLAAGGDIDSALQRAIGEAQQVRKSFAEYVDEFAARCCAMDSTWSRPARRFEEYLPSNSLPGVKVLVLGVDTSGSIDDNDLALMEIAAQRLMDEFNLRAMIVVYCDSQIRHIERFEAGESISLANAKGGGGTRFDPVLRYALELEQQGEELAGVVYLTDLEGRPMLHAEDFAQMEILWATTSAKCKREPPQGLGTACCLHDA